MILFLLGCSAVESGATCADGSDADWGSLPPLAGAWTSTFGNDFFDTQCTVDGLTASTESWIGAFTIRGSPPNTLWGYFGTDDSERFEGGIDQNGGVTFTGTHAHELGTLYANFSGLPYYDQFLQDTITIDGAAFLGLDVDADGKIDCYVRGSWGAKKS